MYIQIIGFGKLMEKYLVRDIAKYSKRLTTYLKLQIVEAPVHYGMLSYIVILFVIVKSGAIWKSNKGHQKWTGKGKTGLILGYK